MTHDSFSMRFELVLRAARLPSGQTGPLAVPVALWQQEQAQWDAAVVVWPTG